MQAKIRESSFLSILILAGGDDWESEDANLYIEKADQGDSESQFKLGDCYYTGAKVKINDDKAFYWYTQAAKQGHAQAVSRIGSCYEEGIGVEKDLEEAAKWYIKSAKMGNERCYGYVSLIYERGRGVKQSYKQAAYWQWKKAIFYLSATNQNPDILKEQIARECKSEENAACLLREKAIDGDHNASFLLGECYSNKCGVERSYEKALFWYKKTVSSPAFCDHIPKL